MLLFSNITSFFPCDFLLSSMSRAKRNVKRVYLKVLSVLNNLRFTDDIVLIEDNVSYSQKTIGSLNASFKQHDLTSNFNNNLWSSLYELL